MKKTVQRQSRYAFLATWAVQGQQRLLGCLGKPLDECRGCTSQPAGPLVTQSGGRLARPAAPRLAACGCSGGAAAAAARALPRDAVRSRSGCSRVAAAVQR
jgi:hypothetical protein